MQYCWRNLLHKEPRSGLILVASATTRTSSACAARSDTDPRVSETWALPSRSEGFERVVASWGAQSPQAVARETKIERKDVQDYDVEQAPRI